MWLVQVRHPSRILGSIMQIQDLVSNTNVFSKFAPPSPNFKDKKYPNKHYIMLSILCYILYIIYVIIYILLLNIPQEILRALVYASSCRYISNPLQMLCMVTRYWSKYSLTFLPSYSLVSVLEEPTELVSRRVYGCYCFL